MYKSNLILIGTVLILCVLCVLCVLSFFPVDNFLNLVSNFPVDAVITFRGEKFDLNDNRGAYNYELKYCIRSITKNMPWIRKIYVLQGSGSKVPSFFSVNYLENDVLLFNDDEVISDKYLPTSNSDSIETFLTNLPGLSEHFIYLNDDMFVLKPISKDYFFTNTGKPKRVIFPRLHLNSLFSKFKTPPSPGTEYWYPHIPIAYTKTEIDEYIDEYPEFVEHVRAIRVRHDRLKSAENCYKIGLTFPCMQLHTNVVFTSNYSVSNGEYGLDIAEYVQFPYEIWKLDHIISSKKFLCIGDHFKGSLEERNIQRNRLRKHLEQLFPEKGRAEF